MLPPKSHVEIPQDGTVFGGETCEGGDEVQMQPREWGLHQSDWGPYKKRRLGFTERSQVALHREQSHMRAQGGGSCLQRRREASNRTEPTGTLLLDCACPKLRANKFCGLNHPACGVWCIRVYGYSREEQ